MKRVSLLALAATLATAQGASADLGATLTGGCPKAFQGFHIGGNIGYGVGYGNQKSVRIDQLVGGQVVVTHKDRPGIRGLDGGVTTGYTHRFGNWGLGLEFVANWANSKGSNARSLEDTTGGSIDGETFTRSAKLKNSLQLRGNFSYVVCELWAPKIILGWDNSRWSQSYILSEIGEPTSRFGKSKRHNGFLWGAGIDFLATKHVIVGFEYTGTTTSKKSISRRVDDVTTRTASWKPQYNKFAFVAKVIY